MKIHLSLKTTFSEALPFLFPHKQPPDQVVIVRTVVCFCCFSVLSWQLHWVTYPKDNQTLSSLLRQLFLKDFLFVWFYWTLILRLALSTSQWQLYNATLCFWACPLWSGRMRLWTSDIFTRSVQVFMQVFFQVSHESFHCTCEHAHCDLVVSDSEWVTFSHAVCKFSCRSFFRSPMKASTVLANSFIFTHSAQGFHG